MYPRIATIQAKGLIPKHAQSERPHTSSLYVRPRTDSPEDLGLLSGDVAYDAQTSFYATYVPHPRFHACADRLMPEVAGSAAQH